jgi:Family of unknown function (DUF5367)
MFMSMLAVGFAVWLVGTLAVRLGGPACLPGRTPAAWLSLYVVSAVAMGGLSRAVCIWGRIPPADRPRAVTTLILPTLMLDACSALFYPHVFPNLDPASAGAFGGWMLACCAGAILGVRVGQ